MLGNNERSIMVISTPRMDNMNFTSSEPKDYLGVLVKGLITSLGIKTKVRFKKKGKV